SVTFEVNIASKPEGLLIATKSEEHTQEGPIIWDTQFTNSSSEAIKLDSIEAKLVLKSPLTKGMSYMTGSHIMASEVVDPLFMQRYKVGEESGKTASLMYLLVAVDEQDYRLFGLLSWDAFICELSIQNGEFQIKSDGEQRPLKPGESMPFESVVYLQSDDWQDLLIQYADLLAEKHNLNVPDKDWVGWGTWDYYTRYFSFQDIVDNVKGAKELNKTLENKIELIQVDGSWWVERGDYYETNERFPEMGDVMDYIRDSGFVAGMHFDGFRASAKAKIVAQHPEYFVDHAQNAQQGIVFFDYSHPGTRAYIRDVIVNARENWGVEYFKVDFMTQGMLPKGKTHLPVTRLERFKMGLATMREAMGDTYFLACNALFGSVLGYVEACRTSKDIKPQYPETLRNVTQNASAWFMHNRLFKNDVDYHIIRSREDEDDTISKSLGKHSTLNYHQNELWNHFVVIAGGLRINSDKLPTLTEPKAQLLQRAFDSPFFETCIPIDFWDSFQTPQDAPRLYLAHSQTGEKVLALFNWEPEKTTLQIKGLAKGARLIDQASGATLYLPEGDATVRLPAYHSKLFEYEGSMSFDELRRSLRLDSR
ncbi:MAG: hypothetical protein AAGB46_14855, partial [Verrucomicrobiota bacterium]